MVRERKVGLPNRGVYEKLRVYRLGTVDDPRRALAAATHAADEFRGRNSIFYLDAIASKSWAEQLCFDTVSQETSQELALFDALGAGGKKRLLTLQGFLRAERQPCEPATSRELPQTDVNLCQVDETSKAGGPTHRHTA